VLKTQLGCPAVEKLGHNELLALPAREQPGRNTEEHGESAAAGFFLLTQTACKDRGKCSLLVWSPYM